MTGRLPVVFVSQRVVVDAVTGERRDALDQRWPPFLGACGFLAVPVPNVPTRVATYLDEMRPSAVMLTGGNDLAVLGGDAPERDATEQELIAQCLARKTPLAGVCRGMQMIQSRFGVRLEPVSGHVAVRQTILFEGAPREVNSYHRFGTRQSVPGLAVCGKAADGIVKAVRASDNAMFGIMWHPEREAPFRAEDIELISAALRGEL